MGKVSNIEWCTSTWNPWEGCQKVSPGCRGCYAERQFVQYKKDFSVVRRTSDKTFYAPLLWKRPELIFTCSISDFFIEEADEWRPAAWQVIKNTPHHFYQILTKRPERIKACLPEDWGTAGYPNVIIGTSVENQKYADERIPVLMQSGPGPKFLSIEPLLGDVKLEQHIWKLSEEWYYPKGNPNGFHPINWVIVGGESGFSETSKLKRFRYRPCEIAWMLSIVEQCREAHTPVFVKQMGTHISKALQMRWDNGRRDIHGHNFEAFPQALQYRQMPKFLNEFLQKRGEWMEEHQKSEKCV